MKFSKAFTLIELLIVVGIGTTIFTVGVAGYREFSRRQLLTDASKKMISDLRYIQTLALIGDKPTGACTKLNGYTFSRIDQDTYTLIANCSNVSTTIKTVDLTGITFTAITAQTMFKVLGQGTDLAATNTVTLTHTTSGSTKQIIIGTGGSIK